MRNEHGTTSPWKCGHRWIAGCANLIVIIWLIGWYLHQVRTLYSYYMKGDYSRLYLVTALLLEKHETSVPATSVLKAKKQILKTKSEEEVQALPVKKVRRVLPEHEGRYKITMPSGSTPRTQKILAKQELCKYYHKRNHVISVQLDTHFTVFCYFSDAEKEDCFWQAGGWICYKHNRKWRPKYYNHWFGLQYCETC